MQIRQILMCLISLKISFGETAIKMCPEKVIFDCPGKEKLMMIRLIQIFNLQY